MDSIAIYNSNQVVASNVTTDSTSITEQNILNYVQCKKDIGSVVNQTPIIKTRKHGIYLNVDVIQKMILRLLTEKKITEKKLAQVLTIKVDDLNYIFTSKYLSQLIPRINLPLIKLYCRTKWMAKGKY